MSTVIPNPLPAITFRSRALGTKLFVIVVMALVMSIAGAFVAGLTYERAKNHNVAAALSDGATPAAQPTTVAGIRLTDSYRSTYRSLHYIPLFLGLVFLTYFLFEVMTGKRVHPAQYVLVGFAQIIFYLLLLSLAEHMNFDFSFLIAGSATVLLFALNTEWIFRNRTLAVRAFMVFTTLYGFIYVLLRIDAYALLIGSIAAFAAIAAAMYITRNVDWYGNLGDGARPSIKNAPMRDSWSNS